MYDPTCKAQLPLKTYDATVYDPAGSRLLVEAGAKARVFNSPVNTADADSGVWTRMAYLGADGAPVDAAYALGCAPGAGCASAAPTVAPAACGGSYAFSLTAVAQAATYRLDASVSGAVTFSVCPPDPATVSTPIGVSVFFGPFPVSHAYHGGNVGVSGDAATFLNNTSGGGPVAKCGVLTVVVPSGLTTWVVVGSPNAYRGTGLSSSLSVTCGGSPRRSYSPSVYVSSAMCSATSMTGLYTLVEGVTAAGQPVWQRAAGGAYLRYYTGCTGCVSTPQWFISPSLDGGSYYCVVSTAGADYTALTPNWGGAWARGGGVWCGGVWGVCC